jgi:iron complex outermembrane receptor protein
MVLGVTAAQAADGDEDTLQEVTVTAQFREQNLQQTPIAITAITSEILESRSQTNLAEVANQAPNVTLRPLGGSFGPAMGASIRGIGQFDFNPAMEPGVGLYVDDVYYASLTGASFDLLDLERIEILRGPQGTLAGKNSIGGSVRMVSKKATGEGGAYISGTYGSRDRVDIRASGDFTLLPDKVFMRLSGVSRSQDGYVRRLDFACANPDSTPKLPTLVAGQDCELGRQGGRSYEGLRAQLRYVASDNLEMTLIGDIVDDDSQGPPVTLVYTLEPPGGATRINGVPYDNRFIPKDKYVSYATFDITGGVVPGYGPIHAEDRSKYHGWGLSGHIDWKLGDNLSLKSISGVRKFNTYWAGDPDVSPLPLIVSVESLGHEQYSQEFRLSGQGFGSLLDYTVGAFYSDQTTTYENRVSFPFIGLPGYDFVGNDPVDSTTKAVFAHTEWHLTDRMNVTLGARYTDDKKVYHYTRTNPDGTPNAAVGSLNGLSGEYSGGRTDYRVGTDFKLTDDSMVYAQFSTGFKGGGVNPRPYLPSQVQPFDPEEVNAFEVGSKNSFLNRRLRLNLSAFYNKFKDIQLLLIQCPQFNPPGFPDSFPCAAPQNAGDATIKGFEMETELRALDRFSMDASLSYIDFAYTRIDPQAGGPTRPTGPQIGDSIPNTPKWKYSLGMQYEAPVSTGGTLTPRLDWSWQDKQFASVNSNPLGRLGSYGLLNARLTYRNAKGDWDTALEVTNVTQEFYYVGKLTLANYIWATPSRPREWALTVKKTF